MLCCVHLIYFLLCEVQVVLARYNRECAATVAAILESDAHGNCSLNSKVYGVNGWEDVVASCGLLYVWSRRCAMLAVQAHPCLGGLAATYPDDMCQRICMLDFEVFTSNAGTDAAFSGAGTMVFVDQAFTSRRLSLWAACADRDCQQGLQFKARLRRGMSRRDEFRDFCKVADSYFIGALQQHVCILLAKAIEA